MLDQAIVAAKASAPSIHAAMTEIGVAYVCFATNNPALYRVMYDTARDKEAFPEKMQDGNPPPDARSVVRSCGQSYINTP